LSDLLQLCKLWRRTPKIGLRDPISGERLFDDSCD
jgi:hypothetical protein